MNYHKVTYYSIESSKTLKKNIKEQKGVYNLSNNCNKSTVLKKVNDDINMIKEK